MADRTIRISGAQLLVTNEVPENEQRILGAIERAAAEDADFLLTPEGSLSGYWAGFDADEVKEATDRVATAARETGIGLALGTCYKVPADHGHACYNQVRVYAPDGEFLGYHAKILRCSRLNLPGTGEMRDYVEGTLRTFEWNGIRFGALICNDMWATPGCTVMPNPYLPWQLRRMGAGMILHAVNSGSSQSHRPFHESSVALWAKNLNIPIVVANASKSEQPVNARSGVMGTDGEWLFTAPDTGQPQFTYDVPL